jgi:hypothetical protein
MLGCFYTEDSVFQSTCQTMDGAHLTSILSIQENGFLHGLMGWYNDEIQETFNLWIGFSDKTVSSPTSKVCSAICKLDFEYMLWSILKRILFKSAS